MNGENKFLKIFALVAFVAFAAVSCWSTTESLFLTLEHAEIPKWVFWIAVVGLYVLTSICTKLVLDSFNQNIYVEHRIAKFVVGVLGVLLLWIAFSMPTNAHTFFYKQMAKKTAKTELTYVDGELQKLSSEYDFKGSFNDKRNAHVKEIRAALEQLKAEIDNPQRYGFGPEAEAKLAKIESLFELPIGTFARRGTRNTSKEERNAVIKYYDKIVNDQLEVEQEIHNSELAAALNEFETKMAKVPVLRKNIEKTLNELNSREYDKEAVLVNARTIISDSYDELKKHYGNLFRYSETVYRSDRLIKVTKVWGDYFNGEFNKDEYKDYTLWYWILLSIIVDIAAFAFFDIALKKEEF